MSARSTACDDAGVLPAATAWIFGYGSLMWQPDFPFEASEAARIMGWHRRFSIYSRKAWGSESRPGLCLALHPGGSAWGVAFRVRSDDLAAVLTYLDRREEAYARRTVHLTLRSEGIVDALTYVANPGHPRFAGMLPDTALLSLIDQGSGTRGTARAYLENTVRALEEQGVRRSTVHALLERLRSLPSA